MKKLLYITAVTKNTEFIGVWKKIKMQENYFIEEGIKLEHFHLIGKNKNFFRKIWTRLPFTSLYDWSFNIENLTKYDCIYIRRVNIDYQQLKFLRNIKKLAPDIKILIEIPTFPYDNEKKFNYSNLPLVLKDRWNRRKINKYIDYILTYSDDSTIFKIPTLRLSNAINIRNIKAKNVTPSDGSINVIAVANFAFWHGYDRFIEGMNEYYKNDNKIIVKLHLVGEGEELEKYKSLVIKYNLQNYVLFYGKKDGRELDKIYDKCEIGLDAMGRHRSCIYYNSTIKGKEYGAKGLPILSGVKTELDYDNCYKYYMRVPPNDSPIEIESVINFYNSIYKTNESKEKVISTIREYTKKRFDISVTWKKVTEYINENKKVEVK